MSDTERCPNCGYCKHCGRSDRYVPAPVPWYPQPWWPWSIEPYSTKPYIWSGTKDSTDVTVTWSGQ